jgi:hypothetical protein
MKAKTILFVAPIVLVGLLVAGLVIFRSRAPATVAKKTVPTPSAAIVVPEPSPGELIPAPENAAAPETAPEVKPAKAAAPVVASGNQNPKPKEERQDPLAREAMALVGLDPQAEAYWFEAINDPGLSDSEREDLIEDLNESGFSDGNGRRATAQDLPLIARRIRIIEELWPDAMDENNWKSFAEVYKDLTNMYDDLAGQ